MDNEETTPTGQTTEELQRQLMAQLDELAARMRAMSPEDAPPPFSPQRLIALLQENLARLAPELRQGIVERLQEAIGEDFFDLETWKGTWYLLNYTLKSQADVLKRRVTGEYETDEWGLDWEFIETMIPFLNFLYKVYWRVETSGTENVPGDGRALLVSNHSGQLPWDGVMIGTAVWNEHPSQRLVRSLYASWFPRLPFVATMLVKMGQALATVENGTRLLEQDAVVAVFPEGHKGAGKPYRERYRLARFGRGGFVKMALNTGAPIIPVSVVGAEETYISLANSPALANLFRVPYFPISPRFPWLGLLGLIPLPTKWYIDFGEPIPTRQHGPEAARNPLLISQLSDQVRNRVQEMIHARLAQRRSVF